MQYFTFQSTQLWALHPTNSRGKDLTVHPKLVNFKILKKQEILV